MERPFDEKDQSEKNGKKKMRGAGRGPIRRRATIGREEDDGKDMRWKEMCLNV